MDEWSQTDNLPADIDLTHITAAHNRHGNASLTQTFAEAGQGLPGSRPIKSCCPQLAKLDFNHKMLV